MDPVLTLIFVVAIIVYMTPTAVANLRGHRNTGAICALNILLGWTSVGWIAAFVWALTNDTQPRLTTAERLRAIERAVANGERGATRGPISRRPAIASL